MLDLRVGRNTMSGRIVKVNSKCFRHSMSTAVAFLVFVQVAVTAQDVAPEKLNDLDPAKIWSSLLAERQKLTSGQVDVEVEVIQAGTSNVMEELNGSTRNYQLSWDHERFRVDLKETRPKNPDDANDFRTSFIDGTFRSIPVYSRPDVMAYEFAVKGPEKAEQPVRLMGRNWVDPRIAGLWPDSFSDLGRMNFEELLKLPSYLKGMEADVDMLDGEGFVRLKWVYQENNAVRNFLLDPKLDFAPREVSMSVSPPGGIVMRDTIACEWSKESIPDGSNVFSYAFPKTITYHRYLDDRLESHEICRFSPPRGLNLPLDKAIFDWPAMGLRPGAVVERAAISGSKNTVSWNGTTFVKWKPVPLDLRDLESTNLPPRPVSRSRRILFWINVGAALACSGYFLLKRLQLQRSSKK